MLEVFPQYREGPALALWPAALGRGKRENPSLLKLGDDERKNSEKEAGEVAGWKFVAIFSLYAGVG